MPRIAAATRFKLAAPGAAHVALGRRSRAAAPAVLGALFFVAAPEAHAACSAPAPLGTGSVVTCRYTGAEQTYVVPAGADRLRIVATGGNGQAPRGFGRGAAAGATIAVGAGSPVGPGSVLYVEVGGNGGPVTIAGAGRGGFNGGGDGGIGGFVGGGGGGGASDVRTCSVELCGVTGDPAGDPRLVVAGGGGGTGAGRFGGGAAGAPSPGADGTPYVNSAGGGGAGSTAGGTGGAGPGGSGLDGVAGIGGAGGTGLGGGGGGGGGFFGGGGGGGNTDGNGAGGGGGSSYAAPAATDVAFAPGLGDPAQVTIVAYSTTRLSPASAALAFGEHDVDAGPSPVLTSTLTNPGSAPVTLTAVLVGGADATQFERLTDLDGDCAATMTLVAGAACDVRVRFDPSSSGTKTAMLTLASNAPEFSVALSGTGTVRVPVPPSPPPRVSGSGSASPLPLTCTGRSIVLIDVRRTATRVEVSGLARTSYRGQSTSIRPLIAGKRGRAVTAPVQPDGSFRATLPLPAGPDRSTVRYEATIAGQRSAALKLVRRLVIVGRTTTAAGTRISAQVAGGRRHTITITRQLSCTAWRRVATVHSDRDGGFSVTLPRPSASDAIALYRATTGRSRGRTFTLPIVVRAAP